MLAVCEGPATSDRLLQRQIASQLAETRRKSLQQLAVDVTGGRVTLSGRVASFYEKQIAIQACRNRADIQRLIDAVEVAGER
jgi:osmotically-inducible protein OsmY